MYEMTRRWVEKGHDVTVVTSPYEKSDITTSKFIERQEVDGINLIVINSADSNRDNVMKRIFKASVFALVSCYFALTQRCDIVIASSGPITVGLPALLAKWFGRVPMVFEVRDLWPDGAIELGKMKNKILQRIAIWFEKMCYRNSVLVVVCSVGMKEGVLRKFRKAETLVIPNASDVTLFDKILSEPNNNVEFEGKKLFLYAGSLGLMDEVEQVVHGMSLVEDPDILLLIIGDGGEREYLENLVKQKRLDNVRFLGLLPKTEVIRWFGKATATFVTFQDLPVLHTSSPNKMFDSFAAGVPIIQSTKGWIRDLVESKQCGINVDPAKPIEFAQAIKYLAYNETHREVLANNAKSLALDDFNRDRLAELYRKKMLELV